MTFILGLKEIAIGVIALGALQFLLQELLKTSLQKKNDVFLEKLRWEMKIREQARGVAEYMAIARDLKESESPDNFRKVNQLAWELAMWLPEDIYRAMGRALTKPNDVDNPLAVVVAVRKVLLGDSSGNLTQNDILQHAPGIGRPK
jgi:hypothetical protein